MRAARAAGAAVVTLNCPVHGRSVHALDRNRTFRCRACRVADVVNRRRRVKQRLVEAAGGRCRVCGYDRYVGALHFHHLDPSQKAFALSAQGLARSVDVLRAEARKCVLLCSNCHAEVEGGVTRLALH